MKRILFTIALAVGLAAPLPAVLAASSLITHHETRHGYAPGTMEDAAGVMCHAEGGQLRDDAAHGFVCVLP